MPGIGLPIQWLFERRAHGVLQPLAVNCVAGRVGAIGIEQERTKNNRPGPLALAKQRTIVLQCRGEQISLAWIDIDLVETDQFLIASARIKTAQDLAWAEGASE